MPLQPARRPVLVGVDGSESALDAARWAAREALRHHVALVVVTAFGWPEGGDDGPTRREHTRAVFLADARSRLATAVSAARAAAPGLAVAGELVEDRPVPVLVTHARDARLLVVGHRGLGGLGGLVLGSVAAAVALHAGCPVVVARGPGAAAEAGRPVVVGVDGSRDGEAALGFAFDAAATRGVTLTAVHAWHDPFASATPAPQPDPTSPVGDEQEVLAERLAGWGEKYPDVTVERVVLRGRAGRVLVEQSERAQLLVVGTRGRGDVASLVLGSVSHAVVHRAHCPVAVVRPETGGAAA